VKAGGLLSYGPRVSDLFRRAAYYNVGTVGFTLHFGEGCAP